VAAAAAVVENRTGEAMGVEAVRAAATVAVMEAEVMAEARAVAKRVGVVSNRQWGPVARAAEECLAAVYWVVVV
jgi:hypothetical protein